ncbi:hypothetical protein LCGC14_2215840 [marine sediment metagenome]|uniref:HNH nuclease domain-containing protein n=1 Tax=marine sediment metagenome TaxID=412755 RepID=A0A0F9FQ55_9ZZZZ
MAKGICPNCGKEFKKPRASSKYCSHRCMWDNNGGHNRKPESWWLNSRGYIEGRVWVDGKRRQVKQHRWVMEQHLGRAIGPREVVHHINGDKTDNKLENLEIVEYGAHTANHNLEREYPKGYKLDLSNEERQRRAERMRKVRRSGRAEANK